MTNAQKLFISLIEHESLEGVEGERMTDIMLEIAQLAIQYARDEKAY